MTELKRIILKPGKERSLLRKHPWIFSGAIANTPEAISTGETVDVIAADGKFLGRGAYSPQSQIKVRIWTFDPKQDIDRIYFRQRIADSVSRRKNLVPAEHSNAVRLIHAESDGLPGVILDRFGSTAVVQILTAGARAWREMILDEIQNQLQPECLIEKSDADVLALEGIEPCIEVIAGSVPQNGLRIHENGLVYSLDPLDGQKTGFYLDQRNNRALVGRFCEGKKVLDCFSFSGGFSLNALAGGAQFVTSVDSSAPALDLLRKNLALNGLDAGRHESVEANVFDYLRGQRDRGSHYDLIILDPPKFAPTTAQVDRAARAYKDINLLALKMLNPGGMLFTFSCSGGVSLELFQKIVSDAALDAGRDLHITHILHQAEDHPVLGSFPEGTYLKGLGGIV